MENIYLILVVVLFALAISDLIVGVSNDAVNFLNSAIGSKVAPRYVILIIASLGIIVGTTFSSGMMEVARKGIFHPDQFYFAEVMTIFLAVMITDIVLLDMFNTFGLPTSTTVSIVFELLGAAVAVSIVKVLKAGGEMSEISQYINSAKALAIISGILLSVIIAFIIGALVQYITRIIFSFNYGKSLKYFGSLWGGIAITAITYFIVIKGAKGSAIISQDSLHWIKDNTTIILLSSFVAWTVLLQLFSMIAKLNILKLVILIGTFALAMAFAGNDLVNFIGVPLAGLKSFQTFIANPGAEPDSFLMVALTGKVKINVFLLLIAGLIMVITLWLSRKARKVTETEINLGRQNSGAERFQSTAFSRAIVRKSIGIGKVVNFIIPKPVKQFVEKRFDQTEYRKKLQNHADSPAFDQLRASVNLTIASIIIAFATSLKLPLSTTYVTFMVAMGTSLSDKAWGRDSAVYRITGVVTVIGGWFFTAFSAFSVAFLVAIAISYGGKLAIFGLIIIAFVILVRTHILFKKNVTKQNKEKDLLNIEGANIQTKCISEVDDILESVIEVFNETIIGLFNEDRKKLKNINAKVNNLNDKAKYLKDNMHFTLEKIQQESPEVGHYYVQVIDYLREISHSLAFISYPSYKHIDNNHKGLEKEQVNELNDLKTEITLLFKGVKSIIETNDYDNVDELRKSQENLLEKIKDSRMKQMRRIKEGHTSTKLSILYLGLLNEIKNLLLHTINLLKAERDFVIYKNENGE
ncbi:MAG: inorganic phosphate transporter [Bacteroidales bacterium]|jgi:phosphate/sulfate permease|nr:inorganic phosphate transporter [Bacteroidales bacterium]